MKHALILTGLLGGAASMAALGQIAIEPLMQHLAQATDAAASPMTDGEVRKVDKDAGKITLRHGPIPHLDMPGMTMVFRAKDPAMLDQVKAGDKVRFSADREGGQFTVTKIEAVK
jgi:Cu(I)/Ag(I) efflux system periplasmic protein CusF